MAIERSGVIKAPNMLDNNDILRFNVLLVMCTIRPSRRSINYGIHSLFRLV